MPLRPEDLLKFGTDNAKLKGTRTATFSLPAGFTCPGASACLSRAARESGKITDGPKMEFRCFFASMEAAFNTLRASVDENLKKLREARTESRMAALINESLPGNFWKNIRIHVGGDFFSADYFRAWCRVAAENPNRLFYGYTKSISVWLANRSLVPENMVITASRGGKWDALIDKHGLRSSTVVFHPEDAVRLGLEVDHDDSLARDPGHGSFALLLHGAQKPGTPASLAIKRMKREGIDFSYRRRVKA